MLDQELKNCQKKLKDAEGDVAAATERGRAKAKQEQVPISPSTLGVHSVSNVLTKSHPNSCSKHIIQDSAVAALKEALLAAERRSDAASASVDAAAAVAKMRDEKEIDLRSQVAALQKQHADMQTAAAAAAAAATKRDSVVASLEQRWIVHIVNHRIDLLPLFGSVLVRPPRVCLIVGPQAA
jgi:hypothetical protein